MAKPAKMQAVLGRCRRLGKWQIPEKSSVLAVMGTCHIDMRKAYTQKDVKEVSITVFSVFGGVEIVVPDGVEVRPSGSAFLASSNLEVPEIREDATLPPILLDSTTIFGRLRLHTIVDAEEAAARDAELARIAEEEQVAEEKAAAEAKKAEEEVVAKKAAEEKAAAEAKKAEEEAAAVKQAEEEAAAAASSDGGDASEDSDSDEKAEAEPVAA